MKGKPWRLRKPFIRRTSVSDASAVGRMLAGRLAYVLLWTHYDGHLLKEPGLDVLRARTCGRERLGPVPWHLAIFFLFGLTPFHHH